MPKRVNENAQMKKEEYDSHESKLDDDEDGDQGGPFERASPHDLAKRRRVSVKKSAPSSLSSDDSKGSTPSSNPFLSVNLTASNPTTGWSFTAAPAETKKVGFTIPMAAESSKGVGFSLGFTPAPKSTSYAGVTPYAKDTFAPTPASGFSFGDPSSSQAAGTNKPFSFGGGGSTAAGGRFSFGEAKATDRGTGGNSLAERFQKHAIDLEAAFYDTCAMLPVSRTFLLPLLDHYLDTAYVLETEYCKRASKEVPIAAKSSVSFASPPAPTPGLFGAASAATPAPKLFKAPPPTPAAPTASALEGEPSDSLSDPATAAASGGADEDYFELAAVAGPVTFYVGGKVRHKGNPKFQQHKVSGKRRLIMRNAVSGKVLVNMNIGPTLAVTYRTDQSKKHIHKIESAIFPGLLNSEEQAGVIAMRRVWPGGGTLEEIMGPIIQGAV